MNRNHWLFGVLAATAALLSSSAAAAGPIVAWDTFGVDGASAFVPPSFAAAQIAGLNITRGAGLSPNAASNSFNSRGWNDLAADDFVQLGFNVTGGAPWFVDSIRMGTRSSATGPGFIDVLASIDGGAFFSLTTLNQPNGLFINPIVPINQLVASSLVIRFVAANGTAANGGAIGSAGTWRIADFLDASGTFEDIIISGTLTPEPTSLAIAGTCVLGLAAGAALRRRRSTAVA